MIRIPLLQNSADTKPNPFPVPSLQRYLLARTIQLFTPGVPMIYYVGILAGSNDSAVGGSLKESMQEQCSA